MYTIKNLTNSPHDLMIRLPAMGTVTAPFAPEYLAAMEGMGYFEISAVGDEVQAPPVSLESSEPGPLDHDGDGKPGGVADPSPLTADEEAELIDAMTDDELRDFIDRKTGTRPHPNAKTETLVKKAKEAAGAAA